jgi:predicted MFS family arabinose efflux permease
MFRLLANHYRYGPSARHHRGVLTYRELFAVREFRVLFLNRCVVMISVAASGLALGTVVYDATGSALLSALSMFGGPLVALVTSQFLLGGSDFVRPRTALVLQMLAAFVADAPQAIPGLPWQFRFVLLAVPYAVNSMFSGTQWVIVRDIVPGESFVLARSALNLAVGALQVVGYAVGGVALIWLTPTELFLLAAVADLICVVNIALGITDRPDRRTATGGLLRRTRAVNRKLLTSPITRPLYLALWVPNGLVVGCEALFVPYAHSLDGVGHGSAAGWLFAVSAAGMMLGDLTIGRYVGARLRDRLIEPLRLLLAVPYVLLLVSPPVVVVAVLAFVASVGYAASLPLQDRLLRHTEEAEAGQVMGLYSQGMMVWQAVGAGVAGALAGRFEPARTMGVVAALSIGVTLLLTRGLRRSAG